MSASATNDTTLSRCPYCLAEKMVNAPVCPVCNRDTLPPLSLVEERDELLRHRDALRAEIAAKTDRLKA